MKNILIDIYLAHNLGDDLFLEVLAKRYPNTKITIYHPGDNYNSFFSNYPNVSSLPYNTWDKAVRKLGIYNRLTDYNRLAKTYDALLFLGGSIFREEAYADNVYNQRKEIIDSFRKEHKKVFFLGCSFGPFKSQNFLNKYKKLFEICEDICFRDNFSYELFEDLKQIRHAPDILWSYETKGLVKKPNSIGYSVINPKHKFGLSDKFDEYIGNTALSISNNIGKGFSIKLFSFCEKEGDLETIYEITKKIPINLQNEIEVINYTGNVEEFLNRFSEIEILYAARFHANILGLLYKTKLIPIIYSHKTSNLLKDIKFTDDRIDFNNLKDILEIEVDKINNNYAINKKKGETHFKYLDNFLKS